MEKGKLSQGRASKKKLPENPLPQNTAKTELSFFG